MSRSDPTKTLLIAILFIAVVAGSVGLIGGFSVGLRGAPLTDTWSPRDYVSQPGDCFVPPQGDPLYDAHYAEHVNPGNCEAYKDQAEAKNIDAETRQVRAETSYSNWAVAVFVVLMTGIVAFFAYAALRKV